MAVIPFLDSGARRWPLTELLTLRQVLTEKTGRQYLSTLNAEELSSFFRLVIERSDRNSPD